MVFVWSPLTNGELQEPDEAHQGILVSGTVNHYGCKEYTDSKGQRAWSLTVTVMSQNYSYINVACTIYDPPAKKLKPKKGDHVEVFGRPRIVGEKLSIMAFGKDISIGG